MSGSISTGSFEVDGFTPSGPSEEPHGDIRIASEGYFETLGIELVEGRTFDRRDVVGSQPVAVIDEKLARQHWPNGSALGKRVGRPVTDDSIAWREVVGVVRHVVQGGVAEVRRRQLYFPMSQVTMGGMSLVVRGNAAAVNLAAPVRDAIGRVDPDQPLYNIKPLADHVAATNGQARFSALLLSLFAGLAAVLAAVGIYGVMSYSVTQRTHELGIRMALGAERQNVLAMVLRQGMTIVAIGIVIGLAGAYTLSRLIRDQLFEVSPFDPATYLLVAFGLAAVALISTYLPALRATTVEPTIALRGGT
jgi:predicted permease